MKAGGFLFSFFLWGVVSIFVERILDVLYLTKYLSSGQLKNLLSKLLILCKWNNFVFPTASTVGVFVSEL